MQQVLCLRLRRFQEMFKRSLKAPMSLAQDGSDRRCPCQRACVSMTDATLLDTHITEQQQQ